MKKKGKFLTFCFSMMPGAAHMYLGFMKQGISIMGGFFALAFLSMTLRFMPVMLAVPVIWFYSFFDALNKNGLSDEEFYALEDYFLFNLEPKDLHDFNLGRFRILIAATMILIGANLLLNNFIHLLNRILPYEIYSYIRDFVNTLPEIILGVVIIFIGIKLILGKSDELKKEALLQIPQKEEEIHEQNA